MGSFRAHLGAYARRNHLAIAALVIAVVGVPTAWALARNSVGPRQLKPGAVRTSDLANAAVTSQKVADGSLLSDDFAADQFPQGPLGPPGTPGEDATTLFAYVRDPGTVLPTRLSSTERGDVRQRASSD